MKIISLLIIGRILAVVILLMIPPKKGGDMISKIIALLAFAILAMAFILAVWVLEHKEQPQNFTPKTYQSNGKIYNKQL